MVNAISVRLQTFDWTFAREEQNRIEAHWAHQRSQKPGLFDGRILLARGLSVQDGVLSGTAFVATYKSFLAWRDFGYPSPDVFNLFAMPALRSAEGAFMVGRMSAGTANAGRLYFPAGTPEPSDVGPDNRVDFDANILRELEEETGITPADVAADATWTILFAGPTVACMKIVRSALNATSLRARVADVIATQHEPELDDLCAVTSLADFDAARMPPFMLHYLADALHRP